MSKKNEVAVFGAKTSLPAAASNDAGLGNENLTAADVGIPQLKLLQALSPQVQDVEGAKAGLFINVQTNEIMESVYFISLAFERTFTVWKDMNLGGGKMGEFQTNEAAQDHRAGLPGGESDYDVQETCAHYMLLLDPTTGTITGPAVIYMDRSKLSAHRDLNALVMRNAGSDNIPRFAAAYKLTGKQLSNKAGQKYFILDVANATGDNDPAWVADDLYEAAKKSYQGLKASLSTNQAAA